MSGSEKSSSRRTLYKTPFSRAYWAQAASEFKSLRVLVFAALMIALRVALTDRLEAGLSARLNHYSTGRLAGASAAKQAPFGTGSCHRQLVGGD